MLRGSSQATTGDLGSLKELKDKIQGIKTWMLSQGKRSVFDNVF